MQEVVLEYAKGLWKVIVEPEFWTGGLSIAFVTVLKRIGMLMPVFFSDTCEGLSVSWLWLKYFCPPI